MTADRAATRGDPLTPLKDETLRSIAASGVIRTFPRNTVLINEGDVGDALYVLLSGRVKVYSSNEAGREFVIDFHGPGEYVGEMSLDGAPRSASVMTVEPTTCAVVNRAQFRDFVLAQSRPKTLGERLDRLISELGGEVDALNFLVASDRAHHAQLAAQVDERSGGIFLTQLIVDLISDRADQADLF